MKITLAPMEGVMDHHMRELLTSIGGIDLCVTEFVRVVDLRLPAKVYRRLSPELNNGSKTLSGTPVRVQLLGHNPQSLASNADKALQIGSNGIDLNFGCPARAVNKNNAGAVLLKSPEKLYNIVKEVRSSVPKYHTLSAKIRLGYEDKVLAIENAQAICEAGADEIAVHARTKEEGYKPPVHWHWIAKIKDAVHIPVIANGDIFNLDDAKRCMEISGCDHLMIGRGALATPNLAQVIKGNEAPYNWPQLLDLMCNYMHIQTYTDKEKYLPNRIKQWLVFMRLKQPQAEVFLQQIRKIKTTQELLAAINVARLTC